MYEVTVVTDVIAQHYLTVPDPGPEGEPHSHQYEIEVTCAGPELNEHDYLIDIDSLEHALDELTHRYQDTLLNDLPEFEDFNPSVERFARVINTRLTERVDPTRIDELTVTVWEAGDAAATYTTAT